MVKNKCFGDDLCTQESKKTHIKKTAGGGGGDSGLQYLLSENEIKVKTALWMAENSDYLKEQKGSSSS